MTVRELIEQLQAYQSDTEIKVYASTETGINPIYTSDITPSIISNKEQCHLTLMENTHYCVYKRNLKNKNGGYTSTLLGSEENLKKWLEKEYKEMLSAEDYFGCEPTCRLDDNEHLYQCDYCYKNELKEYELRDNTKEETYINENGLLSVRKYKIINLDDFIDNLK